MVQVKPANTGTSGAMRSSESVTANAIERAKHWAATRFGATHVIQAELIEVLNDVAAAVSSAVEVEDVLDVIVDSAKRITETDKAIIVLSDEHSGMLDSDTIVVRGRADQHPQEWWEDRLQLIASRLPLSETPLVEHHPAENAWLLCSPIAIKDRSIGLLCAVNELDHPFSQLQQDFLAILSAFAASTIENARLAEQGRYVLLASERDRIAREMHDGVVQSLFSISLGLELCKKQLSRDPVAVANSLDDLQSQLNTSMTELRRFIYDLRPMKLAELGLIGAVEFWVREITQDGAVKGRVVVEGTLPRLTPSEEAVLYRVAKEAVSNSVRHSGGTMFTVTITGTEDAVRLSVADDGDGFDAPRVMGEGTSGIGLRSIVDRVDRDGGQLRIDSKPGQGTAVVVTIPVGEGS